MDKRTLEEYIDACKLAEETGRELREFKKKKTRSIIHDTLLPEKEFARKKRMLHQRMEKAETIKYQIEEWLSEQPMRVQRIVRYRVFERLSWEETAEKMGRGATRDSVRMEYRRFFEKR